MGDTGRQRTGRRAWRRGVAGAVTISLLLAFLPTAGASPRGEKKSRLDTFSGSCEFKVTVLFSPPLSAEERQTHAEALGSGLCTGTWRSHKGTWRLEGDEVLYKARSDGKQSCAAAEVPGDGLFKYRGRTLRFNLFESRVGAAADLRYDGVRGGRFNGHGASEGDPVDVVQRCFSEGLGEASATITGETDPEISG